VGSAIRRSPRLTGIAWLAPACARPGQGRTWTTPRRGSPTSFRPHPDSLEVVAGMLAALAPGALAPGAVVIRAPVANRRALAARAWQRTLVPLERMDGGVALCSGAEVVHMRAHQQGCASPGVTKPVRQWVGDAHLFLTFFHSYKPRYIARLVLVLTCLVLTLGGTACPASYRVDCPRAGRPGTLCGWLRAQGRAACHRAHCGWRD
jgi:hypothetical protein